MKNNNLFIEGLAILFVSIALLFAAFFPNYKSKMSEEMDNDVIAMAVNEGLSESINESRTVELLSNSKESAVIYLGPLSEDYLYILETLNEIKSNYNIRKIYSMDIEGDKQVVTYKKGKVIVKSKGSEFYSNLLNLLGDFTEIYALKNKYGEPINSGYKTIYTPMIIFLDKGQIVYTYYIKNNKSMSNKIEKLSDIFIHGYEKIS